MTPARIESNLQGGVGWALSDEDMALVDALDEELHCNGDDPATML